MNVDLPRAVARYLSVLAAQDIRHDEECERFNMARRHHEAWELLQPACEWDADD